jgi:uncharacterized membrane protein YccC
MQITEMDVSQGRFVDSLEKFADIKCAEVDLLISRLLSHQKRMVPLEHQWENTKKMKERNAELLHENQKLKAELERMQSAVARFIGRHTDAKAERQTRKLAALAAMRAERETHVVEFFAFVLSQLRPHVDGEFDLDEESVRRIVSDAGRMLRSAAPSLT